LGNPEHDLRKNPYGRATRNARFARIAAISAGLLTLLGSGLAQTTQSDTANLPIDKGIAMREPVTPFAEEMHVFHDFVLLPVMVGISVLVLLLLIWVMIRYNSKTNKVASQFSHNTLVEVIWTAGPVFILVFIAMFSFDLLYLGDQMPDGEVYEYEAGTTAAGVPNADVKSRRITKLDHLQVELVDSRTGAKTLLNADGDYDVAGFGEDELVGSLARPVPDGSILRVTGGRSRIGRKPFLGLFGPDNSQIIPTPSVTLKATGFQWGWTYSYPDFGDFEFDALVAPKDSVPSELYLLKATSQVVVPAGETVRIVTTGRDVIHSWAMPSFGIKIDAVPGRLNETWFYTEHEGTYYGQCSEICGIDHAFMPIEVKVVSRSEFEDWVDEQRTLNGMDPIFAPQRQMASTNMSVVADALN